MSEARTPKKNETTTDRGLGLTTHRIDWLTGHCDWSTHARRSFFLKRFSSLKRQISPLFIDFISFLLVHWLFFLDFIPHLDLFSLSIFLKRFIDSHFPLWNTVLWWSHSPQRRKGRNTLRVRCRKKWSTQGMRHPLKGQLLVALVFFIFLRLHEKC